MKLPFYAKSTLILLGLYILTLIIFYGQSIIIPFVFAIILTILLSPVKEFFERRKLPSLLAIALTVLCAILIVSLIFYFIASQLAQFSEALPLFKQKLFQLLVEFQSWLEATFKITSAKQVTYLKQAGNNFFQNGGAMVGTALSALTGVLVIFAILPVYVFVLLLYKPLFVNFFIQVFENDGSKPVSSNKVADILSSIKLVIHSYLVGLLIEASIIAVLNSVGLLILGIDYAILLGVLGAILNVIPYVGGLIAITLPVIIAFATKDGLVYPLAVIGVYLLIQFIDNNIIVPKVVASKVKINAVISILAVLIGGALCGVSGMFLSIPGVAILKVIFDKIDSLRPWGNLLGDELPEQKGRKFN
ncbi:MAG TPA: AI-2E family transporter [Cytophagaceae bacterium]